VSQPETSWSAAIVDEKPVARYEMSGHRLYDVEPHEPTTGLSRKTSGLGISRSSGSPSSLNVLRTRFVYGAKGWGFRHVSRKVDIVSNNKAAYTSPNARIGQYLFCTRRDAWCVVTRYSKGVARWPIGRPEGGGAGGPSLVVCHDLIVALLREDVTTLCEWLGVPATALNGIRSEIAVRYAGLRPLTKST
jgi:hypothetical protein